MKISALTLVVVSLVALLSGCSTHCVERTTRTQTVISEEPVLGQPAHAAPRP